MDIQIIFSLYLLLFSSNVFNFLKIGYQMRTPTIVGTIKHKSLQLDKEFNPKTEYIVKPIVGGL
jgi:hypothetical protein